MAIRTSGTNIYIQLTVKTITDGEKMLENFTIVLQYKYCSNKMAGT
jgi:hypothetical protein